MVWCLVKLKLWSKIRKTATKWLFPCILNGRHIDKYLEEDDWFWKTGLTMFLGRKNQPFLKISVQTEQGKFWLIFTSFDTFYKITRQNLDERFNPKKYDLLIGWTIIFRYKIEVPDFCIIRSFRLAVWTLYILIFMWLLFKTILKRTPN